MVSFGSDWHWLTDKNTLTGWQAVREKPFDFAKLFHEALHSCAQCNWAWPKFAKQRQASKQFHGTYICKSLIQSWNEKEMYESRFTPPFWQKLAVWHVTSPLCKLHKGEVMCCRHETQTICGYRLSTSEEQEKEEVEEEEEEERRMANIRWVNVIVFPNYVRNNRACDWTHCRREHHPDSTRSGQWIESVKQSVDCNW